MVDVEITWLKKKNYARQSSNGKSSLAGLALNSACPTMSKMDKLTVKYPLNLQGFWLKNKTCHIMRQFAVKNERAFPTSEK